jgi:hypothetical protein
MSPNLAMPAKHHLKPAFFTTSRAPAVSGFPSVGIPLLRSLRQEGAERMGRLVVYLTERPWLLALVIFGAGVAGVVCMLGLVWLGITKD